MSFDGGIPDFDLDKIENSILQERMISVRVPISYKTKYEIIQARANKQFADHLRKLIIAAIDKVNLDGKLIAPTNQNATEL